MANEHDENVVHSVGLYDNTQHFWRETVRPHGEKERDGRERNLEKRERGVCVTVSVAVSECSRLV